MATIGDIKVLVGANIDPLIKGLKKAERQLQSASRNFQNIGDNLMKLSAPLLAVGAGSVKMAMDFESSLTQMRSLVGLTVDEVNELAPAIKRMAKETGVSATEAADAMFFITSAGLRGSAAIDALEYSMKAAATGLGETKTIADLVTSTMNAYGTETMSAAKATDVLTATVREGKLEADELSMVMGSVLPLASQMGIKFEEVGAAFAAMSRTGTNAAEASTQLRGIMTSLLKPSVQAEEALNGMGLSSEMLRKQIKDEGLLSVLETLRQKFEGNDAAAAAVFGNVRALSGVLDLTGASMEATRQIFENMADTTGVLDEAFSKYSETTEAKMKKAKQTFMVLAIELGERLMPVFEQIILQVQRFADWLGTLDKEVIANAVQIAMWVAGVGVAFKAIGMLIGGIGGAITTIKSLVVIFKMASGAVAAFNAILLANPIGLIAGLIVGLIAVVVQAIRKYESWGAALLLFLGPLGAVINLIQSFRRHWDSVVSAFKTDGILAGLKRIGLVFLDSLLMPMQQLLELASKLPGVGNLAGKAAAKIESMRKSLDLITVNPAKIEQAAEKAAAPVAAAFDPSKLGPAIAAHMETAMTSGVTSGADKAKKVIIPALEQISNDMNKALFKNINFRQGLARPDVTLQSETETASPMEALTGGMDEKLQSMMANMQRFGQITQETGMVVGSSLQQMLEDLQRVAEGGGIMNELAAAIGISMMQAADQGVSSFADLANAALAASSKIIRGYIMEGVAAATKGAFANTPFPLNMIAGPIAGAAAGVLFNSLINKIRAPKLAKGGLAYGPTMAMVGDNPGANVDPEVISPLSKLKDMIGGNVTVNLAGQFKLNGRDLWLAVERESVVQNRIKGI